MRCQEEDFHAVALSREETISPISSTWSFSGNQQTRQDEHSPSRGEDPSKTGQCLGIKMFLFACAEDPHHRARKCDTGTTEALPGNRAIYFLIRSPSSDHPGRKPLRRAALQHLRLETPGPTTHQACWHRGSPSANTDRRPAKEPSQGQRSGRWL